MAVEGERSEPGPDDGAARRDVDAVVAYLTELHYAGKLRALVVAGLTDDGPLTAAAFTRTDVLLVLGALRIADHQVLSRLPRGRGPEDPLG